MKMILCNVNPHKKFNKEKAILVKLQIDNSLDLGWKKEDIILATNFDYEYNGIKSISVEDENYCEFADTYGSKVSSHIFIIENLFRLGIIQKEELYFYHDFDAYQTEGINEEELELGEADFAATDYGWSGKWNLGVIFFKGSSHDIFKLLKNTIIEMKAGDERCLDHLTKTNQIPKHRLKRLNIRYNFGMRKIKHNYQITQKPLKILHFHPLYNDYELFDTTMNMFFHGKNEVNQQLMPERLKEIFRKFGFDESYGTECTYKDFRVSILYPHN